MIAPITIEWPDTLPLPVLEAQVAPRNGTLVSPLGVSLSDRRSRFQKSYATMALSWRFNHTQLPLFREFWETTLGNGTAQFTIDLRFPLTSTLTNWVVAFVEDGYDVDNLEGAWEVKAVLDLCYESELSDQAEEIA